MGIRSGYGNLVFGACVGGLIALFAAPQVLLALNPMYGINYLMQNGLAGFLILSSVILCATGGEALYADMGHLGREPIVRAWYLVFIALAINYFGQGAFLITHPGAQNILFEMMYSEMQLLYIPFPDSEYYCFHYCFTGDDLGYFFHCIPGDHYPHHAPAAY